MASPTDIAARLKRWEDSLDSADLWPEVPPPALEAAHDEVARVTSAVLGGARGPIRLDLPPRADARALGVAAFAAGMGPLLGYWAETGLIEVDRPIAEVLAEHLDHGRRRAARLRTELGRLLVAFHDRGVDTVLLKGADTAYRYFPDPGTRPMADLDLLVRPEDGPEARGILGALGFVEMTQAESRGHWGLPGDPQIVRSLELTHAENPWHVDLHVSLDRTFAPGLWAGLESPDPAGLEARYEFGRPVRVLPQPLLLAYLAFHASDHFLTPLIRLVELTLVARRDFDGRPAAWADLGTLIERTGTERFVYPALDFTERLVPGTIDRALRERVAAAAPLLLRAIVGRTTPASAQRRYLRPFGGKIMWAASPREILAVFAHAAWPHDDGGRIALGELIPVYARRVRRLVRRVLGGRRR